jgi:hypothetical protein
LSPAVVAQLGDLLGRADDVREQDRREHAIDRRRCRSAPMKRRISSAISFMPSHSIPSSAPGNERTRDPGINAPMCDASPTCLGRSRHMRRVGTRIVGRIPRTSVSHQMRSSSSATSGVAQWRVMRATRTLSSSKLDGGTNWPPISSSDTSAQIRPYVGVPQFSRTLRISRSIRSGDEPQG